MCFSPKISATLALIGACMTFIAYNHPVYRAKYFYVITGFYTIMELLQTIQYSFVNQCNNPINVLLTEFAYLLVVVQPLLWNVIFLLRTKNPRDRKVFELAITMCLVWIFWNTFARVAYNPNDKADKNLQHCSLYNNKTCTYRKNENSHLYWTWQTAHFRDFNANIFMYMCLWFIPALMVEETRCSGILLVVSAVISFLITVYTTGNLMEYPAIWCYISIPGILFTFTEIYFRHIH